MEGERKYQPSPEEIEKARKIMSSGQKEMSDFRDDKVKEMQSFEKSVNPRELSIKEQGEKAEAVRKELLPYLGKKVGIKERNAGLTADKDGILWGTITKVLDHSVVVESGFLMGGKIPRVLMIDFVDIDGVEEDE